jgi:hypothetical protein
MKKDKISVIIILYFSKHLISSIILNVQQQIKDLGEIILINNSGEDIDEFQTENIVVVYPEKNLGYGSGINLGVKISKYEYLLILNPDLFIKKFDISIEAISIQTIISGHNPLMPGYSLKFPSLFASFIEYSILEVAYVKTIDRLIQFKRIKDNSDEVLVDYISGALIFTNKTTFNRIGGFDSSFFLFYEETDFCKRASHLKIPVVSSSKIVYEPKAGKSSFKDVNDIKIKSGINSCKKYHSKYDGAFATRCIFILLKLLYGIVILFISPFSLVSQKLRIKRSEFIYRMRFF